MGTPNPSDTKWLIQMSGREVIESKRVKILEATGVKREGEPGEVGEKITAQSVKSITVYGKAWIDYDMAAEIMVDKAKSAKGKVVKSTAAMGGSEYNPSDAFNVKRKGPSGFSKVTGFVGRAVACEFAPPDTLELYWPMPQGMNLPAVMVTIEENGQEKIACYESRNWHEQARTWKLKLKNGWSQRFERLMSGSADRATVIYNFRVKSLS